jgi:hypothetical protein
MLRLRRSVSGLAVWAWLATCGVASADLIVTFDVPPAVGNPPNGTLGSAINNNGVVAGYYINAANTVTQGFQRNADGTLVAPIIAPGDNANSTRALGINASGTVVGDFLTSSGGTDTFHGFFKNGNAFTQFDIGGPVSTSIFGINDVGSFTGAFGSVNQTNQAFTVIGGVTTMFGVAGGTSVFGLAINNLNQVVGQYDAGGATHGYFRAANGTISLIDVAGASFTSASGINDSGEIVGSYTAAGVTHGFTDIAGVFTTFDVPGSLATLILGVNNGGFVTGTYVDVNGVLHGFLTTSVPEPSTLMLAGVSLVALAAVRGGRSVCRSFAKKAA